MRCTNNMRSEQSGVSAVARAAEAASARRMHASDATIVLLLQHSQGMQLSVCVD